jgi:hypothetical protein
MRLQPSIGVLAFLLFALSLSTVKSDPSPRSILSLDGVWQVAEGKMDVVPSVFDHATPVPGLVSLARPAFVEPGPLSAGLTQKDPRRDAFWYRRTFRMEQAIPDVATIKVYKAMFGMRVILNGILLGEHLPCFTPGYFDARGALKPGENELLIRVGADRDAVGQAIPSGFDFEKKRYIPGIFDSVELVLSGTPHIVSVQAAPDIEGQTVRVQAKVRNSGAETTAGLKFVVREVKSGTEVAALQWPAEVLAAGAERTVDVRVPVLNCRLWSPEDPFLYSLEVSSSTDRVETRFGMREFHLDPATGRAVLNGKPYFMRGTNITLYRFFEDSQCGSLPWNEQWVRDLHRSFKQFHWNCYRSSLGFLPEQWYRIADEEGFLIQDEFPLFFGKDKWPEELTHEQLTREFTDWMRERWNHPSVVIWDAGNETATDETAKAIRGVRGLDLSNRPWDNGYGKPGAPGDAYESHLYHFQNADFKLRDMPTAPGAPLKGNLRDNTGNNPVILNEYGWLWLNRDGSPTKLTTEVYQNLLGPDSTAAQRFHLYARYMAALTEFWRVHRKCAGIMHFAALSYSKRGDPPGHTSDNFVDVEKLIYEPEFLAYVSDAFAPVGLMVNFWDDKPAAGANIRLPVIAVNDLYEPWDGTVTVRVLRGAKVIREMATPCHIDALGQTNLHFDLQLPSEPGAYTIEASLPNPGGRAVRSLRDFAIKVGEPSGL